MRKLIDRLQEEQFLPLTREREEELSQAFLIAEANDDQDAMKAIREEFVNRHLRLIIYIGKGYKRSLEMDEIFAVGLLALTHAFNNWSPYKGSNYGWAERWITTGLTRAMDHNRMIRIPQKLAYASALYEMDLNKLKEQLERDLTKEEKESIRDNRLAFKEWNFVADSIDREVNAGGVTNGIATVGDFIVDHESNPALIVEKNAIKEGIFEAIEELTDTEKVVIVSRFGLNDSDRLTLAELGNRFGVTGEAMRRVEASALAKLKHPAIKVNLYDL
jgi:RNA polymerase primary sigma factor